MLITEGGCCKIQDIKHHIKTASHKRRQDTKCSRDEQDPRCPRKDCREDESPVRDCQKRQSTIERHPESSEASTAFMLVLSVGQPSASHPSIVFTSTPHIGQRKSSNHCDSELITSGLVVVSHKSTLQGLSLPNTRCVAGRRSSSRPAMSGHGHWR